MGWGAKFFICLIVDFFDFTIGRLFIGIPIGEAIGTAVGVGLFGMKGFIYLLEMVDPTEIGDGFIPTATFIALAAKRDHP